MKWICSIVAVIAGPLFAQVPDSPSAAPVTPAAPAKTPAAPPKNIASPLGQEVPVFDPGTEVVSWGGKFWNITDNRIFKARFEKYLSAPEQTDEERTQYQSLIKGVLDALAPDNPKPNKLNQAFVLLSRAAAYDADANLCNSLCGAVVTALQAQRNQDQIAATVEEFQKEIQRQQSLMLMFNAADDAGLQKTTSATDGRKRSATTTVVSPHESRSTLAAKEAAMLQARIAALTGKREVSALQARIQYQALMIQLFFQRRFQHVVIACQLYRELFPEGDAALKLEGQSKQFFTKDVGVPPTVSTLQSLATEFMRDVREGVEAYLYLAGNNEMDSATKRLSEAFMLGEYMPEIRSLPREKKRWALTYMQKTNRLISALEVKDYTQAEALVKELETLARDFDSTKPRAAIETAKAASSLHLAKARNAAIAGDKTAFENELQQAAEIWPQNPALAEMAGKVFATGDAQAKALTDFDQLLGQGNLRQIFNDKLRFIAAVANVPEYQDKLRKVLDDMQIIETAIAKAQEFAKRGDAAGAWETVERVAQKFPDDVKLNQLRGTYSGDAAGFVQALKTAQQLESKGQTGASLAWYLKAQRQYPLSEFAREGIDRLTAKLLPNS